ncbi:site-2 protease family protein [Sulfurisphaera ohwakuensis]|uniref:site-2 protease family protein n=1 Tax=Sulfurisphaera ohwakuensis TaxID=69656 RepID=UPI0036F2F372
MNTAEVFGISLIVFWGLMYLLRKKLEGKGFQIYPFLLLWRKNTRSEWFPKIARSNWYKVFEKIGVGLGIISLISGIALIFYVISEFISPKAPQSTQLRLEPVIPGVTIGINQLPYILLAIGISVTLHELAHAVSATSNNVKVRSGGFLFLIFFPGAFVEPDEEEYNSSNYSVRLKILSAGLAVNLILAAIFFPLAIYLPPMLSQGLQIVGELKNYPAYNSSIPVNSIILGIDGHSIHTSTQLETYLHRGGIQTLTLLFPNGSIGNVSVNISDPQHLLGVYLTYYFPPFIYSLLDFIIWMFTINFSLALFNGAPLIITDGGKVFNELLKRLGVNEKTSYLIQGIITMLFISAILLSINPLQ